MANNLYIGEEKKKKGAAIRVFNILFIIALVVGIVACVLMLIPGARHSIKTSLLEQEWAVNFAVKLNNWTKYHICENFHLPVEYHGHSQSFTSCIYIAILYFGALLGFFLMYLPFLVMHKNNIKNKKQAWRKVILWLVFIFITLFFALIAASLYRTKIASLVSSDGILHKIGHFILEVARKFRRLFLDGGTLAVLKLPITKNATLWATFYLLLIVIILEIILLIISTLGKAKETKQVEVKDELDEKEEETVITTAPVLATETAVVPTIRELAILNSLNPLYQSKIENLPGLYEEIQDEEIINSLEPINEKANGEVKEAERVLDIANAISSNYDDDRKLQVLPGIDEWDANPWEEEDERKDELVKNVIAEETVTEPVEEKVEEVIEEPTDITSTIVEEEKEIEVEEIKVEENEPVEENEEKVVEPVEEKVETPTYKINPVGVKAFDPSKNARKNPIGVVPVAVKKEEPVEEPVEEKEEEKPQVQISAPLHSIEKSKHDKIEVVEARKVHFELKNYQIKTYQGDLSPEEAFKLGATKVQPVVNPVFANQGKEPSWKEKRRQESIRKNGYNDVTTVDTLNGKVTSTSSSKSATSIRDLVKSKKNKEEVVIEKKEDNKISKPIAPINFKQDEKQEMVDEKQEEKKIPTTQSYYHPIAPIQKKEKQRPTIKPVDPMKKK